ncbi:MAG: conjugal transfer protein TraF [Campylobacterales bacterium]|nr:conjugal transfer protein TraF [Campylobacterales bacterium]
MTSTKIVLSLIASACIATTVSAMEFQALGARAASMGGAGIATSPSSLAAYNNPALLANNPEKFSIHLGAGIGIKDTGAGKAVGDLSNLDFSNVMNIADGNINNSSVVTTKDVDTILKARDIIGGMDQKGFQASPTVDLGLSFGSFGTGLFGTSDIGAVATIDQTHTQLIFQGNDSNYYQLGSDGLLTNSTETAYTNSSLAYSLGDAATNRAATTYVNVVGLAVAEVPLAYGYALNTGYGSLAVGGALKLMAGKTFNKRITLDSDNAFNNIKDNTKDTTTYGIDLGLAFKPDAVDNLTLAMVGKNLNSPAFALSQIAGGGEYTLKPAVRAGAAYKIGNWVELAFDADLTENESISHYNTRYLGGGANLDLSFLELNVGLMQNMAANDTAGLIYTAGIATGPKWLHFELAAQMASQKGEIDGTTYPKQAMVNFALSSAW